MRVRALLCLPAMIISACQPGANDADNVLPIYSIQVEATQEDRLVLDRIFVQSAESTNLERIQQNPWISSAENNDFLVTIIQDPGGHGGFNIWFYCNMKMECDKAELRRKASLFRARLKESFPTSNVRELA